MNIKEEYNNSSSATLFYSVLIALTLAFLLSLYLLLFTREKEDKIADVVNPSFTIPSFSHESGFYTEDLEVQLSHVDEDVKIYYTLDGSAPTLDNNEYNEPLKIKELYRRGPTIEDISTSPIWKWPSGDIHESIVLRAAAYIPGKGMSQVASKNYFISSNTENPYKIPLLFLVAGNDDLFGYKKGIYVVGKNYYDTKLHKNRLLIDHQWWEFPANYNQRGSRWHINGNFEYFDPLSQKNFSWDVKFKIFGGITRSFPQKSLSIAFKEKTDFPFFKGSEKKHINSLILRSSGQDWKHALLRDAYFHKVIKDMHLEVQDYQPTILFLNGKFWGLHNIRDHWSVENLSLTYNCNPEDITFLEYNWGEFIFKEREEPTLGNLEEKSAFKEFVDFVINNNFSNDYHYELLKDKVDIDNFIDYIIAQTYCANVDWPNINWKMYKVNKEDVKAKWRFILHDVDVSLGSQLGVDDFSSVDGYKVNMFNHIFENKTFISVLFGKLLRNKNFTEEFLKKYDFHLNHTFEKRRMLSMLNEAQELIAPYVPAHIKRWGYPDSPEQWQQEIKVIQNFIQLRPEILRLHLQQLAKSPLYFEERYPQEAFIYVIK